MCAHCLSPPERRAVHVRGQQGRADGAGAISPGIISRATYLNNWEDAAAGREAALALIRLGVDMLHHNADAAALGAFQAVKEHPGTWIFGANADQTELAPDRVIGSAVIDLSHAFLLVAREVSEGRLTGGEMSFGLDGGVLSYRQNPRLDSLVPEDLEARVAAARDSIVAGTLNPLAGPESRELASEEAAP